MCITDDLMTVSLDDNGVLENAGENSNFARSRFFPLRYGRGAPPCPCSVAKSAAATGGMDRSFDRFA